MILLVLNEKGGVGKTTLSTAFAHAMVMKEGARVLLVDADPQGSVMKWAELRATGEQIPFSVLAMPHARIDRDVMPFANDYDYIVIDAPPRLDAITHACLRVADAVLVPVTPSYYDVWATAGTMAAIGLERERRTAAQEGSPLFAGIVLNRVRAGLLIEREVYRELAACPEAVLLETKVHERTIHQRVTQTGLTVFEAEPMGLAAEEASNVIREVQAGAWQGDEA